MKVKYYKLSINDFYYYGSTIQSLRQRYNEHKSWNKWNLDWTDGKIELLEEIDCSNNEERRKIEQKYIDRNINDDKCLNERLAFISDEDTIIRNKLVNKVWNENNKDKVSINYEKRKNTVIECDKCGKKIKSSGISRHKKSDSCGKVTYTNIKNIYKNKQGLYYIMITRGGFSYYEPGFSTIEEAVARKNIIYEK